MPPHLICELHDTPRAAKDAVQRDAHFNRDRVFQTLFFREHGEPAPSKRRLHPRRRRPTGPALQERKGEEGTSPPDTAPVIAGPTASTKHVRGQKPPGDPTPATTRQRRDLVQGTSSVKLPSPCAACGLPSPVRRLCSAHQPTERFAGSRPTEAGGGGRRLHGGG